MTLWNLIRDFFVENIFGGTNSSRQAFNNCFLGLSKNSNGVEYMHTGNYFVDIGGISSNGYDIVGLPLGDWLSSTFTIITLILLVIVLYIFVKWIFKLFAGLLYR